MRYHEGELEIQRRAGTSDLAARVSRIIGDSVPPVAAEFLAARPFVITATIEAGHVVASIVTGEPGFARAESPRRVLVTPEGGDVNEILKNVAAGGDIGLLAIDFATKRRMRINGTAHVEGNAVAIDTREVYSNCPQYIRPREAHRATGAHGTRRTSSMLDDDQRALIAKAQTFFIASHHPVTGADASHRGGPAGFVTATADRISWPDFAGNNMFNTLGNLSVNPRCGLLFLDFERGTTLQVSGLASVIGDEERRVEVEVQRVTETQHAIALSFTA